MFFVPTIFSDSERNRLKQKSPNFQRIFTKTINSLKTNDQKTSKIPFSFYSFSPFLSTYQICCFKLVQRFLPMDFRFLPNDQTPFHRSNRSHPRLPIIFKLTLWKPDKQGPDKPRPSQPCYFEDGLEPGRINLAWNW